MNDALLKRDTVSVIGTHKARQGDHCRLEDFIPVEVHYVRVHYPCMKNVTLSADEHLLQQARKIAHSRNRTLNAEFRLWLEHYTAEAGTAEDYAALMASLRHIRSGGKYTREAMNER